ncbi:MAG: acyl-CoA dehydrogenase family protein [Gammaproteobacteria bacterium]|nr:acyl-CoA dehydrogenase family protein [Gammaproteobacteria bacterium]MBT8110627.1 acyl-CoA dehydrogenase family protein [Gammaproteobacteria bacterium]NND46756.1 pimeloyl-CoA dehydrogenase small subunit [Woeseiaceae bacterium]NNL45327.1 pimeloyl-CoA dehydrogenase small subunit [Woeseiaceae bacterium]
MDFSLNEVQEMLADSIEKFIDNEYPFDARQTYAASESGFSADVWKTFAELGWTTVPFSEDDGGFNGDQVDVMVMMQRFGRGLLVEPFLANIVLAGGILKRVGSAAQKQQWLQGIMSGELQATLAFTEPQARYDIANIATTATADGADWVLNGQKGLVFNGGTSDLIIVPARTSGKQDAESGITLFAVPADTAGMSINAYHTVDGLRAAELTLNDVRVSRDAVLGGKDEGFVALDETIDDATLAICAEAVGIMQVLKDKTVEYSKNRSQFGVPIGSFQALQHRMVDMLTVCEQAQSLLLWATMTVAEGGAEAKRAVSSIKYLVGTSGQTLGEEAVQLHGGMGVTWDLDVAHYFKRLTAISQLFGNADWHLDKLAA